MDYSGVPLNDLIFLEVLKAFETIGGHTIRKDTVWLIP